MVMENWLTQVEALERVEELEGELAECKREIEKLERELAECQRKAGISARTLTGWIERADERQGELRECQEKLAAAEAMKQVILEQLHEACEKLGDQDGCYLIAAGDYDCNKKALGAALEQARAELLQAGCPVGHPAACIYTTDEGTSHCAWCESLEHARAESAAEERDRWARWHKHEADLVLRQATPDQDRGGILLAQSIARAHELSAQKMLEAAPLASGDGRRLLSPGGEGEQ